LFRLSGALVSATLCGFLPWLEQQFDDAAQKTEASQPSEAKNRQRQ
jgi:hypothetical protein